MSAEQLCQTIKIVNGEEISEPYYWGPDISDAIATADHVWGCLSETARKETDVQVRVYYPYSESDDFEIVYTEGCFDFGKWHAVGKEMERRLKYAKQKLEDIAESIIHIKKDKRTRRIIKDVLDRDPLRFCETDRKYNSIYMPHLGEHFWSDDFPKTLDDVLHDTDVLLDIWVRLEMKEE